VQVVLGGAESASYDTGELQKGPFGVAMTNRREILKAGLAVSALPWVAGVLAAPSARPEVVALYKILYDTRFPESVAFATRAAEHGHAVHAMQGDMTRFWYDDLYHRWRQGPAAIAGLTAYGPLFCLERLAWDQRMRVVYRAEHTTAASAEKLYSWVIARVERA